MAACAGRVACSFWEPKSKRYRWLADYCVVHEMADVRNPNDIHMHPGSVKIIKSAIFTQLVSKSGVRFQAATIGGRALGAEQL